MNVRFPRPLPPKATIGIISPSSPQRDEARLHRGIRYLESLGYTIVVGRHAFSTDGAYLAGSDEQRRHDVESIFADRRIDAIFCARGGYGSARLLDDLDWSLIRKNPKLFVGFSDTTALQLALWKKARLVTFSGAMASVDMADTFAPESEEWFWRALTSSKPLGSIQQPWPLDVIQRGTASGRLIGGNLSVVASMIGTPYMPKLTDSILVLEDVGEETYRIDRMLTQLRLAGLLQQASGLVTGQWSQSARPLGTTPHRAVDVVLRDVATHVPGPVLSNLMYGHESRKLTLPFGVMTTMSSRSATLRFTESATQR